MDALEYIVQFRQSVLVFLADELEVGDLLLTGALTEVSREYTLHYVIPKSRAASMRALAPDVLTPANTLEIDVPAERRAAWGKLLTAMSSTTAAHLRRTALGQSFEEHVSRAKSAAKTVARKVLPKELHQRAKAAAKFGVNAYRRSRGVANWGQRVAAIVTMPLRRSSGEGQFSEDLSRTKSETKTAAGTVHPEENYQRAKSPIASPPGDGSQANAVVNVRPAGDGAQSPGGRPDAREISQHPDARVASALAKIGFPYSIREIFDLVNPLFVVSLSTKREVFVSDLLWVCEEDDMACLLLQGRWGDFSNGEFFHQPTFIACWGEQTLQDLKRFRKVRRSAGAPLGTPHCENFRPLPGSAVTALRTELALRPEDRMVLFGGSRDQFDEMAVLRDIDTAIDTGRCPPHVVFYLPHPDLSERQVRAFGKRDWKHVRLPPGLRPGTHDAANLVGLLSAADAVITPVSTLVLQALLASKPIMMLAFGQMPGGEADVATNDVRIIGKSGGVVWCRSSREVVADFVALVDFEAQESRVKKAAELTGRILVTSPGTFAGRLAHFCRTTAEPAVQWLRNKRASKRRRTISHAYGANLIARDYCGVNIREPTVPGYWMHGWIPAFHNVHPALIALHKKEGQGRGYDYLQQIEHEKEHVSQWVSRQDQADYLGQCGYHHVKAIGLPICYLPQERIQRVPGSLLVMPPHSLGDHGPNDPMAEQFADSIADLRREFELIRVCLHPDDIMTHQWVDSFRKRGIDCFRGADQADPFTLHRLRRILSSFECVTTNGFGSQSTYAAYCGARVCVYGPFAEISRERQSDAHAVKMFPELLDTAYELCTERSLRRELPFLFTDPTKATTQLQWGAEQVGERHRLPPTELAALFNWTAG